MAKEVTNDKKEDVTAQGAANASAPSSEAGKSEDKPLNLEVEAPDWLQGFSDGIATMIESNAKVLESNAEILNAITAFNENASTVVKQIMEEAKGSGGEAQAFDVDALTSSFEAVVKKALAPSIQGGFNGKQAEKPFVQIKKKAKYVVAKGQKFYSTGSETMVEEGTDVTGLEPERLASLIAQGIAVEKPEED